MQDPSGSWLKEENYSTLRKKRVPKQYPWGTIATNSAPFGVRGTVFNLFCEKTVPLCRWVTKTVPLGAPNYGHANSSPKGTISVPFFF